MISVVIIFTIGGRLIVSVLVDSWLDGEPHALPRVALNPFHQVHEIITLLSHPRLIALMFRNSSFVWFAHHRARLSLADAINLSMIADPEAYVFTKIDQVLGV